MGSHLDTFDYVIVGGGAAGSLIANRLSEGRKHSVCVLEAGPPDNSPYFRIAAGFMKTRFNPKYTFQYECEPIPGTAGRRYPLVQGRTIGGGGSINGMLIVRGQPRDYDTWAERGNPGWSYAEVLPYFKRTERWLGAHDDTYRGREGALIVSVPEYPHVLAEAFMDSAAACGMPRNSDYNGRTQLGTGRFQAAIHNGKRVSSAFAFLHPARRRGDVDVRTDAHASRILFKQKRATGVAYADSGGNHHEVAARKGVILSAGTINTPKLLQLSGVGPAELLKQNGIELVHHLPAVGENLRDHYGARLVFRIRGAGSLNQQGSGLPLAMQILRWLLGRPSVLGMPPVMCYAYGKSDPLLADPDIAFSFTPASMKRGVAGVLDEFPGMTCAAWKHRPDSTGHVRIVSGDARAAPLINPNYLSDERDQRTVVAALKTAHRMFSSAPMARYVDAQIMPGTQVQSDDEWLDFARQYGAGTYHLTGTCRMGQAGDPSTVVGPDLRVHGIDGLHVVDASVMPTEPSGNSYAATLMIAEKGSDMILGKPLLVPERL